MLEVVLVLELVDDVEEVVEDFEVVVEESVAEVEDDFVVAVDDVEDASVVDVEVPDVVAALAFATKLALGAEALFVYRVRRLPAPQISVASPGHLKLHWLSADAGVAVEAMELSHQHSLPYSMPAYVY